MSGVVMVVWYGGKCSGFSSLSFGFHNPRLCCGTSRFSIKKNSSNNDLTGSLPSYTHYLGNQFRNMVQGRDLHRWVLKGRLGHSPAGNLQPLPDGWQSLKSRGNSDDI
ncbi:hypothetical protein CEXT_474601 [Caerostris extrusa]|uniref:Uncharacterized protein n=1 Tax=Caerostris extrusa TaxID=172846 RepID=A0AAV4RF05_CAEEX|nr:hypothetical protein CEXT_474601 [Caerostris extrusa]